MFFKRKNAAKKKLPSLRVAPDYEQTFYAQPDGQAPLTESSSGPNGNTRGTSLHSSVRQRENNNRAGNREILLLFFRTGLIIFLLAGGFFALKFGLGKLSQPSEKDKEKWIANAEILEKKAASEQQAIEMESATDVSTELINTYMRRWNEAEQHMRAAEMRERDGMDEEAAKRLILVLRSAPDHRAAQNLLLEIYMRSGEYADAVSLCIRLLDQDGERWGVKMKLLLALQRLGQAEACLSVADPMLEKEPDNIALLEVVAYAHWASGNAQEALALFARILQNDEMNSVALAGSGTIYMELLEWHKALPFCLDLLRLHPNLEHYHKVVECYAQMQEAGKAVVFMSQAASRYGELNVVAWLKNDMETFDPIRETPEYRSFADRMVGADTREAVKEFEKLEDEKKTVEQDKELDLPVAPVEPVLKINR